MCFNKGPFWGQANTTLQRHLALPRLAASLLGAFRCLLSILITLSPLGMRAAGTVQQAVLRK